MSADPDQLYSLRNLFWLGNYQGAINEATGLTGKKLPSHLTAEKEEFVYRSYLALGQYNVILGEVGEASASVPLRAVRMLATFLSNPKGNKEAVFAQMVEMNKDPSVSSNATLQLISAILYIHDDNVKDAMRCIYKTSSMEQHALLVQLYLRVDRLDLATRQHKVMKGIDEDSVLTAVAGAWVNLASGGAKVQEAAYTYDELIDKYGGSCLLLTGLAVAKMHMGAHEEAETVLQESLSKNQSDADTLANIIVVSQHLQRPSEVVARYLNQLKASSPSHALVASLATFEGAFDRVAATLKA